MWCSGMAAWPFDRISFVQPLVAAQCLSDGCLPYLLDSTLRFYQPQLNGTVKTVRMSARSSVEVQAWTDRRLACVLDALAEQKTVSSAPPGTIYISPNNLVNLHFCLRLFQALQRIL